MTDREMVFLLRSQLEHMRDFGLGFALCHADHLQLRKSVRDQQDQITSMLVNIDNHMRSSKDA